MRQISDHVFAEFFFWGCNPGYLTTSDGVFMIDTPQQPLDAVRWREHVLEQGPIRHLVNTEPHIDHIAGNAYFPGVEVIGQRGMLPRYEEMVPRMTSEDRRKQLEEQDPNSSWLVAHPEYPPNPPTRLFDDSLSLSLGGQSIEIIHHPGHTSPQTSVWLPGEGVIFTGDNVFYHVKTFVQEADPWQWLESLEAIRALGEFDDADIVHEKPYVITMQERLDHGVDGFALAHVYRKPVALYAQCPHVVGSRLQLLLGAGQQEHWHASTRQLQRVCSTDSIRGAGHARPRATATQPLEVRGATQQREKFYQQTGAGESQGHQRDDAQHDQHPTDRIGLHSVHQLRRRAHNAQESAHATHL